MNPIDVLGFVAFLLFGYVLNVLLWKKMTDIDEWEKFCNNYCIDCLEELEKCSDGVCPGEVRKILKEKGELPKPDGHLEWHLSDMIESAGLWNKVYDIELLGHLRDGRFGFQFMELGFDGRIDPIDGHEIKSDGKSNPDAYRKDEKGHEYEIKSITKRGLCIAKSRDQGSKRATDPTISNEDCAMIYDKWIFVDRLTLDFYTKSSLAYYVVTGENLAMAISGLKFKNHLWKKGEHREKIRMDGSRSTGDYMRALQLIHAAQQIQNAEEEE